MYLLLPGLFLLSEHRVHALGWLSLIANIVDNTVSVINTATQKVISNIKVDKGPNGITFSGVMFQ